MKKNKATINIAVTKAEKERKRQEAHEKGFQSLSAYARHCLGLEVKRWGNPEWIKKGEKEK